MSVQDNSRPARTAGTPGHVRDNSLLDQLADMDEQCIVEEAQILRTKDLQQDDLTTDAPALPQRSTLRASRFLDNLRLNSIKSATDSISTPHDVYLSSEEDASSSADDFSGEELELDEDEDDDLVETPGSTASSSVSVKSSTREVTARAVSVVFVGRPSIVELSPKSKTFSPPPSSHGPQIPMRSPSRASFAPRHSSLLTTKPSFLDTDPWGKDQFHHNSSSIPEDGQDSPATAKAPTAVLHRFQKSLSMVRKRSRANLKTPTAESPREGLGSLHTRNASSMTLGSFFTPGSPEEASPTDSDSTPATTPLTSTRTRSKTQAAPTTPASPAPARRGLLSSFKKQRRQSLKI
ncbi:uncharacterized protein B0I36DRAFT_361820 [Microdochium trichocladiopsis]|uniref:Uncharacterized protein n=1 Tax=Microdochium trichocladiopsis TaxID=1682393 RepID=A0A9P8Y6N1_9PEZI|nr:uncharacterized protein B0I36DRAFT_361820 [Microdochium trichocladiopsis]KAH7033105.1 hypothetical protein B0I36DRAFT_361820 [Microdochium trichocladiopsis]